MSFEIAPVGFSKPVAEVGAAGFSSIDVWKDYDYETMETAEDIDNILKEARDKKDPDMKNIYLQIMGIMNNYIIKIKEEDWRRKKESKFLDKEFQEKMIKTMNKFNDFYFENKNNIEFMNYFDELVELYVQTKDKNKSFLDAQNKEMEAQIKELKKQIHSKMNINVSNQSDDDVSTESEGESVEPAEEPTNFETDSDSDSESKSILSDSDPETDPETDPDSEDD